MDAGNPSTVTNPALAVRMEAPRRSRVPHLSFKAQDVVLGYLFILVPMGIFLIFNFAGMIFDFWMSFHRWAVIDAPVANGFNNYNFLLHDPLWKTAILNTVAYVLIVVPIQTVIAFSLASMVNQGIRGKTFFRTTFYFPSVTSSVAISLIFIFMFNNLGLVNFLLGKIGITGPNWLNDPGYVMHVIEGQNIWTTTGTLMIIFLAALQDVPKDVLEAAAIDGSSGIRSVFAIVIPLIRPAVFFVVANGVIGTFQIFDQAFVYSGGTGGPDNATYTAVLYIYNYAFNIGFYGVAAAASFILFAIMFVATLSLRRIAGEG